MRASPLLGSWMAVSLLCPHVMKGMKELPFIRALTPIGGFQTHDLIISQRPLYIPLDTTITLGIRSPHMNSGETHSVQSILITTLDSSLPTPLSWKKMDGVKPKVWGVTGLWC